MTEADAFNFNMCEWATIDGLFALLRVIHGDIKAIVEIVNAYHTGVRSARITQDTFKWWHREGRIEALENSTQFRRTHPLRWNDGFVINDETEPQWIVYFLIADIWIRWPEIKPPAAHDPVPAEPPVRPPGRPATELARVKQEMEDAIKSGETTLEKLKTMPMADREKRFSTSNDTCLRALKELTQKDAE